MPPTVQSRMHPSHMSNPFQHLNPQHSVPQTSHYQSQSTHIPNTFNSQHGFGSGSLNGGISPFPSTSGYGANAFTPGAGSSVFNGGALSGQGQGLASVAAQQGFARGAAMQEHTQHQLEAASMESKSGAAGRIRQVWRHNLEQEMAVLRQLVLKYPYVSMDAEFPGIVARPIGNFAGSKAEYHYQTLRCNVDLLKPIQLGITLWNIEGELPPQQPDQSLLSSMGTRNPYPNNLLYLPCTWVFNFKFSLDEDMFSAPSIELLQNSGIEFQKNSEMGIDLDAFGSLLTTSGLVFSEDVHWLSFHSGYDFGYLIKLLTSQGLPEEQNGFFEVVSTYFPKLWDIKFILRHAQRMHSTNRLAPDAARIIAQLGTRSGLQDLADELQCSRIGPAHTGGSDAWLTGQVFWAMRSKIFNGELDDSLSDQIYGLHGVAMPASQQYRDEFFAAQGTPQQQVNGLSYAAGHTPNNPSTPTTSHAGLHHSNQTPGPQYGHNMGGGSLGAAGFGNFQFIPGDVYPPPYGNFNPNFHVGMTFGFEKKEKQHKIEHIPDPGRAEETVRDMSKAAAKDQLNSLEVAIGTSLDGDEGDKQLLDTREDDTPQESPERRAYRVTKMAAESQIMQREGGHHNLTFRAEANIRGNRDWFGKHSRWAHPDKHDDGLGDWSWAKAYERADTCRMQEADEVSPKSRGPEYKMRRKDCKRCHAFENDPSR